jgi:hypothetical protein
MNNPDTLEMQGHIDALRIVLGAIISRLAIDESAALSRKVATEAPEFQLERLPAMTHPTYLKAYEQLLDDLVGYEPSRKR